MKLKNIYYIMRHGQTAYQATKKDIVYPDALHESVPLTKEGVRQVEQSAKKLKDKNIDFIYSSDIHRAHQSAKIVSKKIGVKKINLDKRLRDIDFGIWHNRKKEDFYVYFPKFSRKLFYKRPTKGENWPDCKKRAKAFFKEVDKKTQNKNILVVSHGDILWIMEGLVKGLTRNQLARDKRAIFLKTGSFKKLN